MTKGDLVTAIADQTALTKKSAADTFDAILSIITEELIKGEQVTITGFGSFSVKDRKERKGINPQTGEEITIPATRVVRFTVGKNLKESVKKA